MREVLIPLRPQTDFEKLLFARKFIEEQDKIIKGKNEEIERLTNRILELGEKLREEKKFYEKAMVDLREMFPETAKQINQKRTIANLEKAVRRLKLENDKLQQIYNGTNKAI